MSKPLHPYDQTAVVEATRGNRFAEEISVYAAKRRRRRQSETPEAIGPTPERLAKVECHEEILVPIKDATTRPGTRVVRTQSVFDAWKEHLPEHRRIALQQVLEDFNTAIVTNAGLISSYGEGGGSAPGPRHGGVPDHVREAFARIISLKSALGDETFVDLLAYVVEEANEARRQALRSPYKDKAMVKGLFAGWDLSKLDSLSKSILHWQRREQVLGGRQESTQTEILARRQARMEREARGRGR